MESTSFEQETRVLGPPPGQTEKDVHSLPVAMVNWAGTTIAVVSCWKPTKEEMEEIQRTGRVYLAVMGPVMPPVVVDGFNPIERFDDVNLIEPTIG